MFRKESSYVLMFGYLLKASLKNRNSPRDYTLWIMVLFLTLGSDSRLFQRLAQLSGHKYMRDSFNSQKNTPGTLHPCDRL
ncbi:hypothetical protein QA584_14310 [Anaerocolumna sp. AGMB13025]|uniref:hypothetical protein n=1 Tax=Anaerocolumna sp. AGMB13025 TaxID=3039116 RepID=UPI00241C1489|nr:hypothetical protein [Anaerocolumna sp. AGMB13025]WFR54792.1 hypothetical protein QA584_14310 [Anaerocolumna sp. AGMB13025]